MKSCHNCSRLSMPITGETHVSDYPQIVKFTCTRSRFTSIQPKNVDELRALFNQAAFCPQYREA